MNNPHHLPHALALLVLLSSPMVPSPAAEPVLLKAGAVHTVTGKPLQPGQVLIEEGVIRAVGSSLEPGAARVVDLGNLHLYPGLIAADSALGLLEIRAVRASRDLVEVGDFTPDIRSWLAVNPDSELIPVARANGITHFQPVPQGGIVRGQSGVMKVAGWTTEDMTLQPAVAMHLSWPDQGLETTPKSEARDQSKWKSLEEQARERRAKIRAIDDFFQEAEVFAQAPAREAIVPAPAWEAMAPVVTGKMPLVIHADERREITTALDWAESRGYNVVLAGARDAWMLAERLGQAGIPVIFDHVFTLPPRAATDYDIHFKAPSILHQHGVTVVFSDTGGFEASAVRNLPYLAAQAVAFGLPETEAVKGITLYPAQVLGVADRLGSIEPGKDASLIAVSGNILDIRANVKRMWVAGEEVSLTSRHTRLYEKYRSRPRP